jgi:hypothetical protein
MDRDDLQDTVFDFSGLRVLGQEKAKTGVVKDVGTTYTMNRDGTILIVSGLSSLQRHGKENNNTVCLKSDTVEVLLNLNLHSSLFERRRKPLIPRVRERTGSFLVLLVVSTRSKIATLTDVHF